MVLILQLKGYEVWLQLNRDAGPLHLHSAVIKGNNVTATAPLHFNRSFYKVHWRRMGEPPVSVFCKIIETSGSSMIGREIGSDFMLRAQPPAQTQGRPIPTYKAGWRFPHFSQRKLEFFGNIRVEIYKAKSGVTADSFADPKRADEFLVDAEDPEVVFQFNLKNAQDSDSLGATSAFSRILHAGSKRERDVNHSTRNVSGTSSTQNRAESDRKRVRFGSPTSESVAAGGSRRRSRTGKGRADSSAEDSESEPGGDVDALVEQYAELHAKTIEMTTKLKNKINLERERQRKLQKVLGME